MLNLIFNQISCEKNYTNKHYLHESPILVTLVNRCQARYNPILRCLILDFLKEVQQDA
jgi:hypothetical protein